MTVDVQLDLLDEGCVRCQRPIRADCICVRLFGWLDALEARGEMPWQTRRRKATR